MVKLYLFYPIVIFRQALFEFPIYTKALVEAKKTVADKGCALPAETDIYALYVIEKGTSNDQLCVDNLIKEELKKDSKDDFIKKFVTKSKVFLSKHKCNVECVK